MSRVSASTATTGRKRLLTPSKRTSGVSPAVCPCVASSAISSLVPARPERTVAHDPEKWEPVSGGRIWARSDRGRRAEDIAAFARQCRTARRRAVIIAEFHAGARLEQDRDQSVEQRLGRYRLSEGIVDAERK